MVWGEVWDGGIAESGIDLAAPRAEGCGCWCGNANPPATLIVVDGGEASEAIREGKGSPAPPASCRLYRAIHRGDALIASICPTVHGYCSPR